MKIQESEIIESEAKPAEVGNFAGKRPKNFNERKTLNDKNKFNAKRQKSFVGKSGSGKSFSSGGARGR